MKVKFLGTGLPGPNPERCGQGILISHKNTKILFDCGPGVNRRIIESGINHSDINYLFLSHLHWDHFGDYDAIVQTGFITDREVPLEVFGPPGTEEITDLLFNKVYYRDLVYRRSIRTPGSWQEPVVHEIFGASEYHLACFSIKTFRNNHGQFTDYSLSFRIECAGKAIVISGDTAPVLGFPEFAMGCDLLIHEVRPGKPNSRFLSEARPQLTSEQLVNLMGHCSPRQVGVIARESNPGKLMLIHLNKDLPHDLVNMISAEYKGLVEIACDLMEVCV